jgi:hypothetical protein
VSNNSEESVSRNSDRNAEGEDVSDRDDDYEEDENYRDDNLDYCNQVRELSSYVAGTRQESQKALV